MKKAHRERPRQPAETTVFCCGCNPFAFLFCWESKEGAAGWDGCPKRGQGREKARRWLCLPRGEEMLLMPEELACPATAPPYHPGASSEKQT